MSSFNSIQISKLGSKDHDELAMESLTPFLQPLLRYESSPRSIKGRSISFAVSLRPVDKSPKLAELQQGLLNHPRSLSGGVHIPACHSPPALLTSVSLIEGLSL